MGQGESASAASRSRAEPAHPPTQRAASALESLSVEGIVSSIQRVIPRGSSNRQNGANRDAGEELDDSAHGASPRVVRALVAECQDRKREMTPT